MAHDMEYRGILIWGLADDLFISCESRDIYAVSASPLVLTPLHEDLRSAGAPNREIYITFRGHVLDEDFFSEFAPDVDKLIRVSEIKSYTDEIPRECSFE